MGENMSCDAAILHNALTIDNTRELVAADGATRVGDTGMAGSTGMAGHGRS